MNKVWAAGGRLPKGWTQADLRSLELEALEARRDHDSGRRLIRRETAPTLRELSDLDRGQGSKGLTLSVVGTYPDTYHPERIIGVCHYFPVPPAAYDERSWRRWLLECVLLIERHETCEFFQIDGERPYAPHHGPGNDPYIIFEHGTDEDVRTSFRGDVKPD